MSLRTLCASKSTHIPFHTLNTEGEKVIETMLSVYYNHRGLELFMVKQGATIFHILSVKTFSLQYLYGLSV